MAKAFVADSLGSDCIDACESAAKAVSDAYALSSVRVPVVFVWGEEEKGGTTRWRREHGGVSDGGRVLREGGGLPVALYSQFVSGQMSGQRDAKCQGG
eukprot:3668401-Pleurochrysis_carterae.AAC.1